MQGRYLVRGVAGSAGQRGVMRWGHGVWPSVWSVSAVLTSSVLVPSCLLPPGREGLWGCRPVAADALLVRVRVRVQMACRECTLGHAVGHSQRGAHSLLVRGVLDSLCQGRIRPRSRRIARGMPGSRLVWAALARPSVLVMVTLSWLPVNIGR